MIMELSTSERAPLWQKLANELEYLLSNTATLQISPKLDAEEIRQYIKSAFQQDNLHPEAAMTHVLEGLKKYSVHTSHPRYFGLFNPRASFAGIMADTITAAFNPQLAAWSHAPFAVEVENYLIREFGKRFGYPENSIDGCFCSGGAEANLTALLCALNNHFPVYRKSGLRGLPGKPVVYCSTESHHSIGKAASSAGLGSESLRYVATDQLQMATDDLVCAIRQDLEAGHYPLMIVATLGTTGAGAIDPISEIRKIADQYGCWLHADAAYGGALALHKNYQNLLKGVETADSITFDAHKWLSVPMGAGMLITRHTQILTQSFGLETDYMPKDAASMDISDPYSRSQQWSRRFTGLKLYLSLLFYGWEGLSSLVERQIKLGIYLKTRLEANGWHIFNNTCLPIICFAKAEFENKPELATSICQDIIASGAGWISTYPIGNTLCLRACITNFMTEQKDLDILIDRLTKVNTAKPMM